MYARPGTEPQMSRYTIVEIRFAAHLRMLCAAIDASAELQTQGRAALPQAL